MDLRCRAGDKIREVLLMRELLAAVQELVPSGMLLVLDAALVENERRPVIHWSYLML